jgi:hypothetical protein
MVQLGLAPHNNTITPGALRYQRLTGNLPDDSHHAVPPKTPAPNIIPQAPPALSPLTVSQDLDLKHFHKADISFISSKSNIQRWYTSLHARDHIDGIYTPSGETFLKTEVMGALWHPYYLDHDVLYRNAIMSAAIHSLISSTGMCTGDCSHFSHMFTTTNGDGYLTLNQIVRLVHPLL